ncbi:hypothetical protein EI94DRAFT_1718097 [Lactarius quietus]|nr:hypothetical protein EI94DRAFT_1718097 [Lactarius quietus]
MVYDRNSSDRLSSKSRVMSMLLYDERETNDLRRMFLSVTEQLKQESQRADENERRARDAIQRFKAINEARLAAQQDAARAKEELRLYKLQLEYAQQEIFKAQDILDSLEAQRHDAEASAANARSVARKLKEESLVDLAREEGRRIGLQEGIARGRRLGSENARSTLDRRESRVVPSAPSSENLSVVQEEDARSAVTNTPPGPLPLDPIGDMLTFPPSPSPATVPNLAADTKPVPVPVVVRNTPPPPHPENIIPPDGFIPHADNGSTIRLPPPHEMVPTVAPSSPVSPAGTEPLMVPNPGVRPDYVPFEPESPSSTTISQFELVSEPSGSITRPSRRNKPSLSVIAESVSSHNTPADRARSISVDPASRPPSSAASVPYGQSPVLAQVSPRPTFQMTVADPSSDPNPNQYLYRRPSFASSSSGSAGIADRTPLGSTRSLHRMTSLSSVPEITIQAPSRSQSQTPQATPFVSHRAFLSAEDAVNPPASPTLSTTVLASPSSPKIPLVPHDSPNPAGGTPKIITLPDGQFPPGFVPHSVSSPSLPSRTTPVSTYATPAASSNGVIASTYATPAASLSGFVASPKVPTQTDPRSPYGVPVPDGSSSSGRHSLYQPVRIPVTSTTADSSVMVPPASIFSQPEPSSSETTEDDAVASSIASSNDTFTTPPPSRKKAKAKAKRPSYDAAPTPPGQEYPTSPLIRGGTLASSGPSTTSAGRGRGGSAGMTPAARPRSLRH